MGLLRQKVGQRILLTPDSQNVARSSTVTSTYEVLQIIIIIVYDEVIKVFL
jgi:hypothetical protein